MQGSTGVIVRKHQSKQTLMTHHKHDVQVLSEQMNMRESFGVIVREHHTEFWWYVHDV